MSCVRIRALAAEERRRKVMLRSTFTRALAEEAKKERALLRADEEQAKAAERMAGAVGLRSAFSRALAQEKESARQAEQQAKTDARPNPNDPHERVRALLRVREQAKASEEKGMAGTVGLRSAFSRALAQEKESARQQAEPEHAKDASPSSPDSSIERVRAMLREQGVLAEDDPFEHMLERMKDTLREEAIQLREANDEQETRLSSPAEVNAIVREWARTSDRRQDKRLAAKVYTSLDERVEALQREKQQMLAAGELRAMLSTDNVAQRWSNRPWTSSSPKSKPSLSSPTATLARDALPPAGRPSPGRLKPGLK